VCLSHDLILSHFPDPAGWQANILRHESTQMELEPLVLKSGLPPKTPVSSLASLPMVLWICKLCPSAF